MGNSMALDRAFAACSHPLRRRILERLAEGEMTVGQVSSGFGVSKPAVSKLLKVMEEAGAIARVIDGRTHRLQLRAEVLDGAGDWIERQRALWVRKLDVVDEYLRERREQNNDDRQEKRK